MSSARRATLFWLSAALLACGDDEPSRPTQIVVVIDAEDGVRAQSRELALVVRARSDGNESVHNETLRAADSMLQWPWRLALTPKDDDASRVFEVVATARDRDSQFVAQVRAISSFVKGETRQLNLMLEDACIGEQCGGDQTCARGDCVSAEVDPSTLPEYDEDTIPDPVVVGPMEPDAGGEDGSVTPPPPVGGEGGPPPPGDAGPDGSVSPGCERNPDSSDQVCPEICPETCNGRDDDCDRRIDEGEGPQDECEDLPNARGRCARGECEVGQCATGFKNCDMDAVTGCESGPDDVDNCGVCLNACSFPNMTALCVDNDCVPDACLPLFADCDMSGDSCETPLTTLDDCRACGVTCTAMQTPHAEPSCSTGTCGPGTCIGNWGDCNLVPGDGCEEPLDGLVHCGACGMACDFEGGTDDCSSGSCLATSCDTGYLDCDVDPTNGCESLSSEAHCGQCNRTCDASLMNVVSASCGTGSCVPMCDEGVGFGDCDSDPFNGCETSTHSLEHCMACDVPCARENALASCDIGSCELVRCNDGFDDCDGDGLSCEQSLDDPEHCGDCDTDCTVTVRPFCSGGVCMAIDCSPGTADCDLSGDCETDLTSNMNRCGACDNACEFTSGVTPNAALSCVDSACTAACQPGWGDCNRDYRDGCEVALNTLSDCGGCGEGCSIANATETCATGSCLVQSCDTDWDDCNGDDQSCETALDTSTDCGSCGNDCDEPNAVMTCGGGSGSRSCEISACTQAYYADCDTLDDTGCEVDTRSATEDCGACDNDCNTRPHVDGTHCENSSCVVDSCDLGWDDCSSSPGCETALGTLGACGSCTDDCTQLPHTTATACTDYSCDVLTCAQGWASCDGEHSDGCETNIFSVESCGGCEEAGDREPCTNLPNVATTSCTDGTCRIVTCASGWVDCDGSVANGCEQSLSTVGPCFPDTNCTKHVFQSRNYFFCTNDRNWGAALARCDMQLGGALVRIDGATENAFVLSHLSNPAWIGASDATTEGRWNWIDDLGNPSLFFVAGMGAQNGAYINWGTGEPNGNNTINCGGMVNAAGGPWGDDLCTATKDFVCEVQLDLCPNDPNKTFPGQCGCGVPDTDGDGDGTANCNDGCPTDPAKVAPGICNCGTPDTDSDGDGSPDCVDECPMDPTKTSRGVCGCDVPDTDTDNDGQPDCIDPCPYVADGSAGACAFPYVASNFDPRELDFASASDVDFSNCGSGGGVDDPVLIDTSGEVSFYNWCGEPPRPYFVGQNDGSELAVLPMLSLYVPNGVQIRGIL